MQRQVAFWRYSENEGEKPDITIDDSAYALQDANKHLYVRDIARLQRDQIGTFEEFRTKTREMVEQHRLEKMGSFAGGAAVGYVAGNNGAAIALLATAFAALYVLPAGIAVRNTMFKDLPAEKLLNADPDTFRALAVKAAGLKALEDAHSLPMIENRSAPSQMALAI